MDAMNSNYCGMDAIRQLAPKKITFDKRQLKEIRRSNYQFNHVQRKYQMYYCSYFIQKEFDIRSGEDQISTLAGTHILQVRDREKMRAVPNAIRFIWSLVKSKTTYQTFEAMTGNVIDTFKTTTSAVNQALVRRK